MSADTARVVCDMPDRVTITEPGVYSDLPAQDYHAQTEWLSWSSMKHLLPPNTPAHFKAAMDAGQENKRHFDVGKVVHHRVLGEGDEYVVVRDAGRDKEERDATGYETLSARAHRDAIFAQGKIPILRAELDAADAMAESVRAHRTAHTLLSHGTPEVSLFWVDPATGVKCRARLDWLPKPTEGRRLLVPDLKSAVSAAPIEFAKAAARHGYYGQHMHYLDGIKALGIDRDPAFLFVVVEKAPPHLVSVGQFADREDLRLARTAVDRCRGLYRDCLAAGDWPGYGPQIHDLTLPVWLHYLMEDAS